MVGRTGETGTVIVAGETVEGVSTRQAGVAAEIISSNTRQAVGGSVYTCGTG